MFYVCTLIGTQMNAGTVRILFFITLDSLSLQNVKNGCLLEILTDIDDDSQICIQQLHVMQTAVECDANRN